jgi:hypothetical protein
LSLYAKEVENVVKGTAITAMRRSRQGYLRRSAYDAYLRQRKGICPTTMLAAQQAGRPDLICSPKRVLAHLWEGESELSNALLRSIIEKPSY